MKDSQHHNVLKNIKIVAMPGSHEDHNSAMRNVKDGADRGQIKPSGQATKDKA